MEYSVDGGTNYTSITSANQTLSAAVISTITAAKDIKIRTKAVGATPPGIPSVINILASPSAPIISLDTQTGEALGSTTAMEYSIDNGTNWSAFVMSDEVLAADIIAGLSAVSDFKVRLKASAQTLQGIAQTIDIQASSSSIDLSGVIYERSTKTLSSGNLSLNQVILYRTKQDATAWNNWKIGTVDSFNEVIVGDPQAYQGGIGAIEIRLIKQSGEVGGTLYIIDAQD
jgi:hypothetical protein